MTSPSNSQEDIQNLKPRGRRGNTCFNCRRRRIRCDGAQPICTNCARGGTQFEDCEFPSTSRPSQVAILEDRIATVRDRIRVLEDPNQSEHVALHHPYFGPNPLVEQLALSGISSSSYLPFSVLADALRAEGPGVDSAPSSNSPSPSPGASLSKEEWDVFFRAFSANSHHYGFFLNPERLWRKTMLDAISDDDSNLLSSLREAISLWNTRLSAPDIASEEALLSRVLDGLSSEIPGRYRGKAIQVIQAEILVAYYFLYDGKVLQASHHADAAFSLALASGFHQIRIPASAGPERESATLLALKECDEKTQGFWDAVVLNSHCATSLGLQAPIHRVQLAEITTPWPTDPGHAQVNTLSATERPLQSFLQGASTSGYSIMALYTKATILLERVATSQKNTGRDGVLPWNEVQQLDAVLEALRGDLVLTQSSSHDGTPVWLARKLSITAMLIQATTIRLHLPYNESVAESRTKCLEAANGIGQAIAALGTNLGEPQRADPTLGTIWAAACDVLVCELMAGRLINGQLTLGLSSLHAIYQVWLEFVSGSGLLQNCLAKCEEGLGVKIKDVLAMARA